MEWCWDKLVAPVRRIWIGVAGRLGFRRTHGLWQLRKEVRTCEYEDIQVMWEMLRKNESEMPSIRRRRRKQRSGSDLWAAAVDWFPHNLCRAF